MLLHNQELLRIGTRGKSLHNITNEVEAIVARSRVQTGLCTVFVMHSSASLIIQENADPDVLTDLETFFTKLVPEYGLNYRHTAEGSDDMPAHIRAALTKTSENIPIARGRLVLGIWQGIYVWEHRDRGRTREIMVHISGN
ncbi:secondary thiamine-phosphate synthase enzyme YjbQ [Pseudanabaena sp. PCC 6802]|uniref:secondary thiamine-phosphate synthase enzyme YjbQ n=1 Tax=Pseudanabaena sp. PCC 6802 TaxID=118173 RepID=UPI000349E18D|nr:secondary thiamine-phosphate synthase enzyme YjbQ [Pseudanabaena sp. PCC 6802]